MCRPQAEAIYGTTIADQMEAGGVFDHCLDTSNSSSIKKIANPFSVQVVSEVQEVDAIGPGSFDALMCRPQAEAIYGATIADQMEAGGVFDHCLDTSNSSSVKQVCEFGVCHWGTTPVPYYVNGGSDLALVVELSVRELTSKTNARFTKLATPSGSYIQVVNSNQCGGVSVLGKAFSGGSQKLEAPTASNCGGNIASAVSVTTHELMHALGLFHEQARPDRDTHIIVNWQNIQNGQSNFNYAKRGQQKVDALGLPYDYQSIMHYSSNTFSNGNGPTMVALNGQTLGGDYLTAVDKAKINGLYPRQRHTCKAN